MTSIPVLKTRDLKVTFRSRKGDVVTAIAGLSLELARGSSLSVVGESGSGKTTLLRCITALEKPSGGTLEIEGKNPFSCSAEELMKLRQRCGYIPQDPYGCIPPTLGVKEAVEEPFVIVKGRVNRKEGRRKSEQLLSELGLEGEKLLSSRIRTTLSGGQRQRVSVARALVLDPILLIADEPTSMQDASTRGEILRILKKRVNSGMSMIFVTHDLFLARSASENTMVMYRGYMCERGNSEEVLQDPLHPYTRALHEALPRLGGSIRPPSKNTEKTDEYSFMGCPFQKLCPDSHDRCSSMPPLRNINGREVACWKYL